MIDVSSENCVPAEFGRNGDFTVADLFDRGGRIGFYAEGVESSGHEAVSVLRLLFVQFFVGVRGYDANFLFVNGQPQSGVEGLGVGAEDDHVVASVVAQ